MSNNESDRATRRDADQAGELEASPRGSGDLDRLAVLLLGRLSTKKAPSVSDVAGDLAKLAAGMATPADWRAQITSLLDRLAARGLIEPKPLRLTSAGREALRSSVGLARAPTWEELRPHLAAIALGLEPGSPAARRTLASAETMAATILARRFGVSPGATLPRVIDELAAGELSVAPERLTTERLRARVLARRLGVPERDTVAEIVDALINETLALPAAKLDWKKLRKQLLARRGGTAASGTPAEIATRIAGATLRVTRPDKRSLTNALVQRWVAEASPASPAPAAAPADDFAAQVLRTAAEIVGPDRYGERRVFISPLWRRLTAQPGPLQGISLERFKRRLVEANRDGELALVRADLVDAMDPATVAESEISDLGATFHFVLDASRS